MEHHVKGAHGVSPATLGYLETDDYPMQDEKWVTTSGFHLNIQVVTLQYFTKSQKGAASTGDESTVATKLQALEDKLAGMKAEHEKDVNKLADNL